MDSNRTAASETTTTQPAICGARAYPRSSGADRDSLRAPQRVAVEHAAARNGVRVRHHLLAAFGALATGGGLEALACGPAQRVAAAGPDRSDPSGGRQFLAPRAARGGKTGPNPTDRHKAGSKHHVLTDAHGIPLVALLTAANRHDITQLLPLVDAMPTLRGCPGRPVSKPRLVQGDRGYDSQPHRDQLWQRGIASQLAKRGRPHGSGPGPTPWVVER